jgi:transposase
MNCLEDLGQFSIVQKDALIVKLWNEVEQLRQENNRLKEQIENLQKKVSELEEKLNKPAKNSHNSSIPPSQDKKSSKTSEEKKEKQRREASVGRKGGGRELHPNPDKRIVSRVKKCPHCGERVSEAEQSLFAVYDKIEIPPVKPIVTRVEQYGGHCHHCGKDYVSPVPRGYEGGSPFGKSVETLATYYRYTHVLSYERLSQLFGEVYNIEISEGSLANLFMRVKEHLGNRAEEILMRLRSSRLVCSDETGMRVKGGNEWEWVFQNDDVCVHVIRPSRGHDVIDEVMNGHKPEIWVSDLYGAQRANPAHKWQVCLSHQLRDCQYGIEAGDSIFAPRMKKVLLRAFAIHKRRERLKESTLYQYRCDLKRRLTQCLSLTPTHKEGIKLQKRYKKIEDNLFLFLEDATIPPTNNGSERAFRMSKVFQKVTNCFRSDWGKELYASVRTVVNTGKRQGLSAFEAIKKALSPVASFFAPT